MVTQQEPREQAQQESQQAAWPRRRPQVADSTTQTTQEEMAMASGSHSSIGSRAWSASGLAATVLATLVARKALTTTWRLTTGKQPPQNPAHPDVSMSEAATWAALSGVSVGLARMLASRKAADYYRRSTGHLPPNLDDVEV